MKRVALGFIAAISLLPGPLAAQAVTGTILGTVTDSSGGMIPGATITLTHTATGLSRTVVSDAAGEYTVPSLPIEGEERMSPPRGVFQAIVPTLGPTLDEVPRCNAELRKLVAEPPTAQAATAASLSGCLAPETLPPACCCPPSSMPGPGSPESQARTG